MLIFAQHSFKRTMHRIFIIFTYQFGMLSNNDYNGYTFWTSVNERNEYILSSKNNEGNKIDVFL